MVLKKLDYLQSNETAGNREATRYISGWPRTSEKTEDLLVEESKKNGGPHGRRAVFIIHAGVCRQCCITKCSGLGRGPKPWTIMPQDSRCRNWCFTINNPTCAVEFKEDSMVYLVYGREVGENGTPHLQGFVQLRVKKRLQQVKDLIGQNPHLQIMRGTTQEAAD